MKASSLLPPSTASPLLLPYIPEESALPSPPPPPSRSPPRRHARSGSSGSHSPLLKSLWRPSHARTLTPEYGGLAPDPSASSSVGVERTRAPAHVVHAALGVVGRPQSERPRRSLSSPFPLASSAPVVPPRRGQHASHLPLFHHHHHRATPAMQPTTSKERFAFPLDKDRPFHPSSTAHHQHRRGAALDGRLVAGRLARVLVLCALLGALALVTRIGGDVLAGLGGEAQWETDEAW